MYKYNIIVENCLPFVGKSAIGRQFFIKLLVCECLEKRSIITHHSLIFCYDLEIKAY